MYAFSKFCQCILFSRMPSFSFFTEDNTYMKNRFYAFLVFTQILRERSYLQAMVLTSFENSMCLLQCAFIYLIIMLLLQGQKNKYLTIPTLVQISHIMQQIYFENHFSYFNTSQDRSWTVITKCMVTSPYIPINKLSAVKTRSSVSPTLSHFYKPESLTQRVSSKYTDSPVSGIFLTDSRAREVIALVRTRLIFSLLSMCHLVYQQNH